jgi:hypothetical protein
VLNTLQDHINNEKALGVGLPGVVSVKPNTHHETHTTRSWDFLGLDYYQPSQNGLQKGAKYGEEVIVGVIDSGFTHSF